VNVRGARRFGIEEREEDDETPPRVTGSTAPEPRDRIWRIIGGIALVTFVVHVVAAARMRGPIINGDESGYLGNARYLVQGVGRTHAGYAAGYSVLLTPAAFLSHDPLTAYHLSLVVNALLAASIPLLGVFLARRVLPSTPPVALVGTALLLVLYPGWAVIANLTLSENALVPAVLATACVIATAGESLPRWCLAAALASYTSFVSPRGLVVVLAFGIACVVATQPWKSRTPGIPALLLALVLTLAARGLNVAIAGTSHVPGVSDGFGSQVFRPLIHPGLWRDALANVIGRSVYSSIATFGTVVVGVVVLSSAWARRKVAAASDALAPVAVFAVPVLVLTLVLGAFASAKAASTATDYLVYGRYVDAVLAPVLAVGAAWLFGRVTSPAPRTQVRQALALGAVLAVAVGVFALVRPAGAPGAHLNVANALALRIFLVHVHRTLPVVMFAAVATTTLGLIVFALERRVGAIAILVFLAWSSWTAFDDYVVPGSAARAQQRVLVAAITRLRVAGVDTSCVVVDSDPPSPSKWHLGNDAFLVPTSTFSAVVPPDPDCGPLVVSAKADVNTRFPGARPVSYENNVAMGLWVIEPRVAEPARAEITSSGLLGPVPVTAALPESAYRSSIVLTAREMTVRNLQFRVELTHVGQGSPWPGSYSLVQPKGVGLVHLSVVLAGPNGLSVPTKGCSVPRTMLPGDTLSIDCNVRIAPADTARLKKATGPFTLGVELEQLGVTKFSEKGDLDATLRVDLRP
jgi:hypothetical protein